MRFTIREQLVTIVSTVWFAGCGGLAEFPVAPANGSVVCESKPMEGVMVYLEPLATGDSAIAGKPAMGISDSEGQVQFSTYMDGDGAVVGKHRVRVAPRGNIDCPCELNENVDVTQVEVTEGGPNRFDIVLPKRTGRRLPNPADDDE